MKRQDSRSEKGVVLILALLLLLVVTLIGINAINTTTFEANISGNKRASEQAFYSAEAGINEFLGRFRDGEVGVIDDASETNPLWKFYIAQNQTRAVGKGYNSSGGNHIFSQSLQTTLDYVVEVRHKVNPSTSEVIRFGVEPYYVVNSSASASGGGKKEIEIEIVKRPSYDPPSALYSEGHVTVSGNATIQGNDQCGGTNPTNKPAIIKTKSELPQWKSFVSPAC